MTLAEASQAIKDRKVSSHEMTNACVEAAHRLQPSLNAFIDLRADAARRAAIVADQEMACGRYRGPMHGIPLAHKDIFYRDGMRTTAGSAVLNDFRPTGTAMVLQRLDTEGAIDLGTLNLAEYCVGPTGQNDHTGGCCNPWNTDHITGGSSSGSGAVVAARVAYGSIGSDTGGSIRLPSGICGVVGLKPSYGRVSLSYAVERCWSLDVFGPLARTAEDAALLFDAIAGHDPYDPASVARPASSTVASLAVPIRGLRLAVAEAALQDAPADIALAHKTALDVFRALGVELLPVQLPDFDRLYDLTMTINNWEATALHDRTIRERPDLLNASTLSRVNRGHAVSAQAYIAALRARQSERAAFEASTLGVCDALYLPLLDIPVPTRAAAAFDDAEGADSVVPRLTHWTRWASYLGAPGLSLPIGFDPAGLPIACQLIGRYFDEATLLRFGHAFQQETGWHRSQPPFS